MKIRLETFDDDNTMTFRDVIEFKFEEGFLRITMKDEVFYENVDLIKSIIVNEI